MGPFKSQVFVKGTSIVSAVFSNALSAPSALV